MSVRAAALPWLVVAACAPSFELEQVGPAPAGCVAALAPHDIQGAGGESPWLGQVVEVGGVVTLAVEGQVAGLFIQALAPDADPLTSEGLFVAYPGEPPAPGTRVRVRGRVGERRAVTELGAVERLDTCGTAPVIAAAFDAAAAGPLEPWEGMWVRAAGGWAAIDLAELLERGHMVASPEGRLFAAGHELGPATAHATRWVLERAAGPPRDPSAARLGSIGRELKGVVLPGGPLPRLLLPELPPSAAPAPPAPARLPARVRVVALNLQGYFIQPRAAGGRGPSSPQELEGQRAKLVAALLALDADVLALTEVGNDGEDNLGHLLGGLAASLPGERGYQVWEEAAPASQVIRAAIAWRPARLRAREPAWFDGREGARPPLLQSFESAGRAFAVGVVHFESKRCDAGPEVVSAFGCGEAARLREAELLITTAAAARARQRGEPLLVLGDFNADALEPPLLALRRAGFVDLLAALPVEERYSHAFAGRASLLDHALAAPGAPAPGGEVAIWHINADEPPQRAASFAAARAAGWADARRCSDHDPVIVDLAL